MSRPGDSARNWAWIAATLLAVVTGLLLLQGPIHANSATYDEVTYLDVAVTWWQTGEQDSITRMGSPLTFWKLQQAATLGQLEPYRMGYPLRRPSLVLDTLLPVVRTGACWVWGVGFVVTAHWARRRFGLRAMAAAAWLYTLSPNLIAHSALITMEIPIMSASVAMFYAFARFLDGGRRGWFLASGALAGLAFSCKFTAVLFPPILAAAWFVDRVVQGERRWGRLALRVFGAMAGFGLLMIVTNLVLTGFATIPLSERTGDHPVVDSRFGPEVGRLASLLLETPLPQDWVGFARQMSHQRGGGSSYLFGERRMHGWWYYYFVCLAVKVPLTVGLMIVVRLALLIWRREPASFPAGSAVRSLQIDGTATDGIVPSVPEPTGSGWRADERLIAVSVVLYLLVVSLASSRNYGLRYLLPLAPLAIVWSAGLAEAGRVGRLVLLAGLAGQAAAVVSCHPHELSYFHFIAGGTSGGRRILADSNLDWGQGLLKLARWQREKLEHEDLTTYYFGNTDPHVYGVIGKTYLVDAGTDHPGLPGRFTATTRYVAVSTSLQFGPWGPEGYFDGLSHVRPLFVLDDGTMAIYRAADIPSR